MSQNIAVLVHKAKFLPDSGDYLTHDGDYWFVRAVNLGDRAVEITHAWVEGEPTVHILDRLPIRLEPDESWISYVAVRHLEHIPAPAESFVIYTSRQNQFHSSLNESVPPKGNV